MTDRELADAAASIVDAKLIHGDHLVSVRRAIFVLLNAKVVTDYDLVQARSVLSGIVEGRGSELDPGCSVHHSDLL